MRSDRPRRRLFAAAPFTAFVLALPATGSFAQLIDDFEAGPFSFNCGLPGCSYNQFIGSHGIEPTRSITLWNNNVVTPATADLSLTTFDDAAVFGGYGGLGWYFNTAYDPPGVVDLTGGGTYEYFFLRASAVAGTEVDVSVTLDNGFYAVATVGLDPSGITLVPWSAFGVLTEQDLQAVDRFDFTFHNDSWFGWVDITVWDIRLGRHAFGAWDGTQTFISWTPGGRKLSLLYDVFTGGSTPAYQMALRPFTISGASPAATMTGFDAGGGVGLLGSSAGSTLTWTAGEYATAIFDLVVDLTPAGGYVLTHPPDPILVLSDGASLELRSVLGLTDPAGAERNVLESLRFDLNLAQPLLFEDAVVTPVPPGPGATASYHVSFKLTATGDVDEAVPLFTSMMTADYAPAGTPTAAPAVPPVPPAGLSAQPSVTAGPTRLVFARPPDARSEISVFDVAGRLVRRLGVGPGAPSVEWDGRDTAGRDLPAGVYFASLASAESRSTARVVVVR